MARRLCWSLVAVLACGPSGDTSEAPSDPSTGSEAAADPVGSSSSDASDSSDSSSSSNAATSEEWESCWEVGEDSPICVSPITDGGTLGFGESRWHFVVLHTHPWEEGLVSAYNDETGSPLFEVYSSDACAPVDRPELSDCVLEVRLSAGDHDQRYDLSDRCNCAEDDAAPNDAASQPVQRRARDCSCCGLVGGANRGPEGNRQRQEAYRRCIANGGGCTGGCPRPASTPRR